MNRDAAVRVLAICMLVLAISGCGGSGDSTGEAPAAAPAKVERKKVGEAQLATITLTPEAEKRLGLVTVAAEIKPAGKHYTVAGEVVVPPGQSVVVGAPVAGSVSIATEAAAPGKRLSKGQIVMRVAPLLPVARDLRANAQADVEAAETRLETAKLRAQRAAKMLSDGVGSVRAKEDAEEAVRLTETALAAARAKLKQLETTAVDRDVEVEVRSPQDGILQTLHVGNNQMVASGTPLFEVAKLDPLWIRTPVYAGDLSLLKTGAAATVKPINAPASAKGRTVAPVSAPPTADPFAATTDLYYRIDNASMNLRPGQKVSVTLPVRGERECLQVPYAAVLYDINGGTWAYEMVEPHVFARRRILVESTIGDVACIAQGLNAGALIVTDGAAELFGTEFGIGK